MSTQHTPGPWSATGSSANYTPPGDRSDRSEMMDWSSGVDAVAPFTENEHGDFERVEEQGIARAYGRTIEEAKANARLIAAAPGLLAALQEAERHLTAISHPGCGATPGDPLHTIRAAIAAATRRA